MSASFEEANKAVHKVEDQWHYPILTRYGYEALTREAVGFVRGYMYKHPITGRSVRCNTGVSADYWEGAGGSGYWSDLEPHLKKVAEQDAGVLP